MDPDRRSWLDNQPEHVWVGTIRDGHVYVTDQPDCGADCLGIHNGPDGTVNCAGQPI